MKVLSIKEPHASLLLTPYKTIETRSWATSYRGEIYLHASQSMPSYAKEKAMWDRVLKLYDKHVETTGENARLHCGLIYAKAELVDCILMTPENIAALPQDEIDAGYYAPGRYMWVLKNVVPLPEPIPAKGHLGIWNYEENHQAKKEARK